MNRFTQRTVKGTVLSLCLSGLSLALAQGTPSGPAPVPAPVPVSPAPSTPVPMLITPGTLPPPLSSDPIYIAYPPEKHQVAFDHVLLEGSVLPGAKLLLNGQEVKVGGDGLFIEWVPLQPGENLLVLESTLGGTTERLERRVIRQETQLLSGAAQIEASSITPDTDRVAYLRPQHLELQAVPVSFKGTPGGQASFRVGELGPFPMVESRPGEYQGTFLLPEKLDPTAVSVELLDKSGTKANAPSKGKLSVTAEGPRVAQVSAAIPGRGLQAGTAVWRNGLGRNFIVYPRPGARTIVVGEEGTSYTVQVAGGLTLNAPKSTLTLLPVGTPLPQAVATVINVHNRGTFSEVKVNTDSAVPFTVEQQLSADGSSLDLRLFHTILDVDYIVSAFPTGAVREVRWTQDADGVGRVHIDLRGQPWGYDATYDEKGALTLRIRHAPAIDVRRPLAGQTLVIDPGHGGDEFGGAGPLRQPEKQLTLALSQRVGALLQEKGAKVILTRQDDRKVPIYDRPLLAETENASALISIHANGLPDGVDPSTRRGAGVYFFQPQARPLAEQLLASLMQQLPDLGNDGIHYQNLALARPTTQLSVLIETAFLTDSGNLRLLMSETGRERLAQAIVLGLERYYREAARGKP